MIFKSKTDQYQRFSESKYRALMMIEKDDFNRQLIHSYGARGVALVRLLEEKEDSDEVGYKNQRFLHHLAAGLSCH